MLSQVERKYVANKQQFTGCKGWGWLIAPVPLDLRRLFRLDKSLINIHDIIKRSMAVKKFLFLALMVPLFGCAVQHAETPSDPLEDYNRFMFEVNRGVDVLFLRPLAGTYRAVTPEPVRQSVSNFFHNASTPLILANDVLQGEVNRAGTTLARFVINSTIGVLGLFDMADDLGFAKHSEDFGQTLAVWGVGDGPYLVLPIFGSSNPRDAVGRVVDYFSDPLYWWADARDSRDLYDDVMRAQALHTRAQVLPATDDLESNSVDYYATMRSLYQQRRSNEINNQVTADDTQVPGTAN